MSPSLIQPKKKGHLIYLNINEAINFVFMVIAIVQDASPKELDLFETRVGIAINDLVIARQRLIWCGCIHVQHTLYDFVFWANDQIGRVQIQIGRPHAFDCTLRLCFHILQNVSQMVEANAVLEIALEIFRKRHPDLIECLFERIPAPRPRRVLVVVVWIDSVGIER